MPVRSRMAGGGITDGLTIPALAVRRAETTVELPSGGSLVIGGLLQQQTKQNINGFPGLKDLPVLGALVPQPRLHEQRNRARRDGHRLPGRPRRGSAAHAAGYRLRHADRSRKRSCIGRLNAVYGKNVVPPNAPRNTVGYIVE